jgi:hypothetical protein
MNKNNNGTGRKVNSIPPKPNCKNPAKPTKDSIAKVIIVATIPTILVEIFKEVF